MSKEYVLRDLDHKELARLQFQHDVWQEQTSLAIQQASLSRGNQVADLGCGPGYLAEDLAQIVGPQGAVYAIDNSAVFIQYLESKNQKHIHAINADLRRDLSRVLPHGQFDAVFCRWVLMFIDSVESILQSVHGCLKPGGKFVSIEYFRFHEINIYPESPSFSKIYDNVHTLLTRHGGNPDIGGLMPALLLESGFSSVEVFPCYRTGKPGSPLWKWLEATNVNHSNLVDAGLIQQEELNAYHADWKLRSADPTAFITAPPLMVSVGVK